MPAKTNITHDTPLTPREQDFANAYRGNSSQAALDAGCTPRSAPTMGYRMFRQPNVRAEIDRQVRERSKAAIVSRDEMQQFFSATIRDDKLPLRERLHAAQLLGKTRGDFSEKLEVKGELDIRTLLREAAGVTE